LNDSLLTAVTRCWTGHLDDAVRVAAWSPNGRLLALGADGRALIDGEHRTAPMGPDPLDAVWLGERRVAVIDNVLGAIFAGSGDVEVRPVAGARCIGTHDGRTMVAGNGHVGLFGHPDLAPHPELVPLGIGQAAELLHLFGAIWVVGGTFGVNIVDTRLACIDGMLDFDGVVALAGAAQVDRFAVADLGGSIHVVRLRHLDQGIELTGYTDPVRLLALSDDARVLVAAADDELTVWQTDDEGDFPAEPLTAIAHEDRITALSMGSGGIVATGDASGLVRFWSPRLPDYPVAGADMDAEVTVLEWNADATRIACGTVDGGLALFDVEIGRLA
jgi:hypothetical protein